MLFNIDATKTPLCDGHLLDKGIDRKKKQIFFLIFSMRVNSTYLECIWQKRFYLGKYICFEVIQNGVKSLRMLQACIA